MQIKLLFYSNDSYFLNQVSDYISRTQRDIQVVTYSDMEKANAYLINHHEKIDAVLTDEMFFTREDFPNILRIQSTNCTDLSDNQEAYYLNIYQQGEDFVRDLKKICIEKGQFRIINAADKEGKIISFFSMQGGVGQSTIAYQLAANLALRYKVLYLSLDYINVYQQIYPVDYPIDMSQVMFQIKDKIDNKENIYRAIVRNQHGIYVLPSFQSVGDVMEVATDEITFLLQQLTNLNEFDYILVDLRSELHEMNQTIMELSRKVVAVYSADLIGERKRTVFLQDPYIQKKNLLNFIQFVKSKVMHEIVNDNDIIMFPYVQLGADLFTSFYNHSGFRKACAALEERISLCN